MGYDHQHIEEKWQRLWEERELFQVHIDQKKPKYYVLDMFPYPSGAGLHVGHVAGYTGTDVIARYKRQKGFNVLHPMGWDSFGLPAEQYAVRTGIHPAITTEKNIHTYRRQLKRLGFSYDWSRELATSHPKYYKWTQWIFTQLYERGLAYEAEVYVNFCPALGTVLANEEVENGRSVEGGYPIVRRPLRQWMLKITEYAERLLEDLSLLDWPEHLKKLQEHWIGKSEGAKVYFREKMSGKIIETFTTRVDTIFGVTFLVLAPEHPLVMEIASEEQKPEILAYLKLIQAKSDLERTELSQEKSGVWTGAYAVHPLTDAPIPIWIADYVLMHYGTGIVQAVPAHDIRDFAFAKKYQLPLCTVICPEQGEEGEEPWTGSGILINSGPFDGLKTERAREEIVRWLAAHDKGEGAVMYKMRDWLFSRQRYWGEPFPILHFSDGTMRALELDELPLLPPELTDFKPSSAGESPLAKSGEWVKIVDEKTGRVAHREINTMPQWAGSCWYYLRFLDPHNDQAAWDAQAEAYWMPVDLYVGGVEHAVLHLLYARFWHKVLYDCGLVSTLEPFQTLRNQGLVMAPSYKLPEGGYVDSKEVREVDGSFFQLGTHALLRQQTEKMSKSKLNGVTPDEMIEEHGADALRLYELFMGPFDKEKLWNSDAVHGCRRFLQRFYTLIFSDKIVEEDHEAALKLGHRLVEQCERDIENMHFNTAISTMMEFINAFAPLETYPKSVCKMFTQVLYPFAPHIAEEAWEHLGEKESLAWAPFPKVDTRYLEDDMALYVVQVNGKLRGKWMLPKDVSKEELLAFIQKQPNISKHMAGVIEKVIFVPNKLLNVVCRI